MELLFPRLHQEELLEDALGKPLPHDGVGKAIASVYPDQGRLIAIGVGFGKILIDHAALLSAPYIPVLAENEAV
jgi:hypothetical protein